MGRFDLGTSAVRRGDEECDVTQSSGTDETRREWLEEAEAALDKARDAIRAAWDESREPRSAALESAKQAAKQLADAVDRGFDVARERWGEGRGETDQEPAVMHDAGEAAQAEETLQRDPGQNEEGL